MTVVTVQQIVREGREKYRDIERFLYPLGQLLSVLLAQSVR